MPDRATAGGRRPVRTLDPIVVVGGGGHGKVVISILQKLPQYHVLGYTDVKDHGDILGIRYLGTDGSLPAIATKGSKTRVALAVGQVGVGTKRHELWTRIESRGVSFPAIVSPDAVFNAGASAEDATVMMDGVIVNCGATIGRGAILNTNSTIEHDVVIADWVHVAPGATISGGSKIGRFSMIGAGATVIEGIRIAECCVVGAGSTVVADLTEPGVYVGSPARRIK